MAFLALEPDLIARLKAKVTLVSGLVLSQRDMAGVKETSQPVPALAVLYDGYKVLRVGGDGEAAQIEQYWLVVVMVRNATQTDNAASLRSDADPIVDQVLAALLGWRPPSSNIPLAMPVGPGPAPLVSDLVGYFPLAFRAEIHVKGDPT